MLFFLFFLIHEIFKVLLQLKYIFLPIPRHDISYIRTAVALFFNSKGNTYSKVYKIRPLKRIKWRQFSSDRDFIRHHDGCRQRGIDRFFLFPRCLLRSGSQGPGRVARAANIESRSTSPMCLFLPDSPCLPAAKFIPLNGTCQQTRDPLARKPSETVFENSSRQTRVKKKEKKKKRKRGERLLSFVVSHRIMAWKIFLQLRIRLVEYHSPLTG